MECGGRRFSAFFAFCLERRKAKPKAAATAALHNPNSAGKTCRSPAGCGVLSDPARRRIQWGRRRGTGMSESSVVPADRREGLSVSFLVLVLASYLAVHLLLRLALSPSLIPDESSLALFSQSLDWGYSEQPPLYSWLVWGAVRLLGLSIFSLTLVRMLVLAAVPLALYATARAVLRDRSRGLLCVFSLFLFPSLAWNALNYLTHSLLLCAISLATARAFLLLPSRRSWQAYAMLGLWLGLGMLAKYNFALFAAS